MLLFLEGFETYGASAGAPVGLNTTWVLNGSHTNTDLVAGRAGGLALRLHSGVSVADIQINVGSHSALLCGFAYRPGAVLNNDGRIVSFREGNTEHLTIRVQPYGEVSVYRGTTLIATSSGAGLFGNAWCYIEVKVTIGNSGSYEVRVNGNTVLSATNVDTQNGGSAAVDNVRFYGNNSSDSTNRVTFDDLYIADLTAGEVDDFIGSYKVVTVFPNSDGDSTDFAPSAGANWQCVDDNPSDDDSSYVEGDSGDVDLSQFQNFAGLTSILGVQQDVIVRETDATPFDVKLICKSGSTTDVESVGQAIASNSYVDRRRIYETDPNTGSPWTPTELNNAQFGVEAE